MAEVALILVGCRIRAPPLLFQHHPEAPFHILAFEWGPMYTKATGFLSMESGLRGETTKGVGIHDLNWRSWLATKCVILAKNI